MFMRTTVGVFALFYCFALTPDVAAAQEGPVATERAALAPGVESIVNNFKPLLKGSTIIVVNTDGDEQQELAKVESFLAGKKGGADTLEIMASVKRQFRTDTIGFSHPIWLSDRSATGNACVLGVRQNTPASYTALVSEKIDKPLMKGTALWPIDSEVIQASIVAHEMYHCYEYMRGSMLDFWSNALQMQMAYAVHRSESVADAYATLYVLQHYDAMPTLRTMMEFRRIGMMNSDVEHNTSMTVEPILKHFKRHQLAMKSPAELIRMAAEMRDGTIMNEKAFVSLKKSAIEITGAYRGLLSEFQGLGLKKGKAQLQMESDMLLDDAPRDRQLTARVLSEITTSLYKIGAGSAVSSRYYQPLLQRYAIHEHPALRMVAEEIQRF
jgi:hypothetical protein